MDKAANSTTEKLVDEVKQSTPERISNPLPSPFKRLGLYGLEGIAPIILAALATEEPLLLIGPHGTAKSLLLTRIAAALGLEFRHYNASLLNFDDLVGFPLPGKEGRLEYVRTPAAVWGAGAVIFDEISRCRPEIQNKLFPIVHERRVQGIALDGLRYRWAAMNPPATDEDDNGYIGSEPLDAALADRFTFVVDMPAWTTLTEDEQLAVIRAEDSPIVPADAKYLAVVITQTHATLQLIRGELSDGVATYVQSLVALLAQAGIVLSPRRAGMLFRSVLAVNAAALVLNPGTPAADAALLALRSSLPQRAQGIIVSEVQILAAHRDAWYLAGIRPEDPLKVILCTVDPIERLRIAVATPLLSKDEFSRVVADVLAQLKPGSREAASVHLFETGAVGRLNAAVADQAARYYREIATPTKFTETLHATHARFRTWGKVKDLLSRLDPAEPRSHLRANALAAAFARKELVVPEDAEDAFNAYAATELHLRSA